MSAFIIIPVLILIGFVLGYVLAELAGDGINPIMDGWQAILAISWVIVSIAVLVSGVVAGTVVTLIGFIGIVVFVAIFIVKVRAVRDADVRRAIMPG